MLKLSYMARAQDHGSYDALVAFAKEIGLDMIDFHVMGTLQETGFLRDLKYKCVRAGLPIGYLASGVSLVGPAGQRGERLARAKSDTDSAAYVGAQVVHVFARHKWPATEEEQELFWQPMIEDFQELADYAAARGVVVSLQNHNHGSFAMNADQVLRILHEVGRRNFTYILDTGQWEGALGGAPRGWHNTELDIYRQHHARVAPCATCLRAKIYKIDNGYEEWLDYPRIFRIMRDADYNGAVSICFEGGDPPRNRCDRNGCIAMGAAYLRECIRRAYA
mgnify:FL=1